MDKLTIALEAAHILSPEVFDNLQDLLGELPPFHKSIVSIVRQIVKNYLITHCHETTSQLKKDFCILLRQEFNQQTILTIKKRTFQVFTAKLKPNEEEINAFFPEQDLRKANHGNRWRSKL